MRPTVLLSNPQWTCASFVWPDVPRCYAGYRFVEHEPLRPETPLPHTRGSSPTPPPAAAGTAQRRTGWRDNWQTDYDDPHHPLRLSFHTRADGSATARVVENGGRQTRTWRFVPDETGARLWMTLHTEEPLPGAYIVQQCLRFTGGLGFGFPPTVATVPFLSELLMQALGNANGTITWVRRDEAWQPLPVPFTRCHTAAGAGLYADSAGRVDSGLIVRETPPRDQAPPEYWQVVAPDATWHTWSAGLYWERTAYVSNRHPADCLHAGVDLGPLPTGGSRAVAGKFYWLEGTKDDLLALWREEFGDAG